MEIYKMTSLYFIMTRVDAIEKQYRYRKSTGCMLSITAPVSQNHVDIDDPSCQLKRYLIQVWRLPIIAWLHYSPEKHKNAAFCHI